MFFSIFWCLYLLLCDSSSSKVSLTASHPISLNTSVRRSSNAYKAVAMLKWACAHAFYFLSNDHALFPWANGISSTHATYASFPFSMLWENMYFDHQLGKRKVWRSFWLINRLSRSSPSFSLWLLVNVQNHLHAFGCVVPSKISYKIPYLVSIAIKDACQIYKRIYCPKIFTPYRSMHCWNSEERRNEGSYCNSVFKRTRCDITFELFMSRSAPRTCHSLSCVNITPSG